jgi:two-component system sensor kinase FixL
VTMTALHDESGKLRGFGKVVRDITDQKAAEAALERRESHLRSILETVPDAMIVISESGDICSFSAAAERLFGYAEADLVGRNVSMLMPDPDRARHDDYISHYLATGERRIIGNARRVTGLKRNGDTFPMELAVGETASSGLRLFTGFVRDLTERRRTELRLQELQSELIHVSRWSAMGTMASTLAHELNQPLTAIANYLETSRDMLNEPDAETIVSVRNALDDAAGQSLRAGQIVRRLRDFVARGEIEKQATSLTKVIDDAAALGLVGADECGVRVTLSLDADSDLVLVDNVQIQQVVVNLIHNAIHAMTDSPYRELAITTASDEPGLVRVTVADTGSGVAADMAERLFLAFETSKEEGLGLGLSICRTIVEAHGGRIWAEPRSECGAAFHFTLMRGDREAESDE